MSRSKAVSVPIPQLGAEVSALLDLPPDPKALVVLAHGAGAGMHHRFFEQVIERLTALDLGVFRYQFPYMEKGRRAPDRAPKLETTVRAAVAAAARQCPGLPLFAGGKSMGGRMTSRAASAEALPAVKGLVFFGFPLHPAGKPGTERGDHLDGVTVPMLFLQGDRDKLAGLDLLQPVCSRLGPKATLHVSPGADHSFHVLKRSGRTDEEVLDEICGVLSRWIDDQLLA
ncbi:MAG: alpha/beta family hydrolase [Acidobacteriota bacterium]